MKVLVFVALMTVATADVAYPKAAYPAPSYDYKKYDYPAQPHNFAYAVKDDYYYSDFGHMETSDGKVTTGSYRAVLPDGRTQIVTYKADEYGYVADVKYEGETKAYDYKPAYKAASYPAPSYPAASYPTQAYKAAAYQTPAYPTPSYSTEKY